MKVLIVSHNTMSTKHSIGKTLLSLFSEFKKEELCQLYIHTGMPERNVCDSFYQITDVEVLRGVFSRNVRGRNVVASMPQNTVEGEQSEFYRMTYGSKKNRQPYREILRDVMWNLSPWYNQNLRAWIEEQKPSCIFAAIGSGTFLYDISVRISKEYNIPLFTYVCDDFYSMQPPKAFMGKLWKRIITRKTNSLMTHTSEIVTICDELTDYYSTQFKRPTHTVMTGTNFVVAGNIKARPTVKVLRYFGKLSLNRYKSLADICRELDTINRETGASYSVDIFSDSPDEIVRNEFSDIECAVFHGFVSGAEFEESFFSSDILIHIEAFDSASIDRVKYSVSTKIADTLASGIPMLAYGPECVASIGHLIRNQCAFVATNKEQLKKVLLAVLGEYEKRNSIAKRAIKTADQYHNPEKVSRRLYSILNKKAKD